MSLVACNSPSAFILFFHLHFLFWILWYSIPDELMAFWTFILWLGSFLFILWIPFKQLLISILIWQKPSGISCIIYPQEKNPSLTLSHFTFKILILYLWTVQNCGMQIIKSNCRLTKKLRISWETLLSISFQTDFMCKCNFLIRNPPFVFSMPPILLS